MQKSRVRAARQANEHSFYLHAGVKAPENTRPLACLAVKWLCSGHAQFVSFHPGLMSGSTQGLSAPFETPFRTGGLRRALIGLFLFRFVGENRVIAGACHSRAHARRHSNEQEAIMR